jgi:pimeloyl-ACP methyl ester carboxylesterase
MPLRAAMAGSHEASTRMIMKNDSFARSFASIAVLLGLSFSIHTQAKENTPVYGAELEGFAYAYPVRTFDFASQGKNVHMAYLDVPPTRPAASNGRTVVLMHGKLFCADTWRATIKVLTENGFRVIAPDQIGFCKSTKPDAYQYSFQQLASNTHRLLQSLHIKKYTVIGHSMGGMLATRFALMYPESVEQLALINPLGLEDWKALGVPYVTIDEIYQEERKTSAEDMKDYQRAVHYGGEWRPEFDRWITMQAGMYNGPGGQQVARSAALTHDMIFNQPVVYEFDKLTVPTVLFVGLKDKTAFTNHASADVVARLANYTVLGKAAAARIPQSTLVEFADLAHSPHLQDPERFHRSLLIALGVMQESSRGIEKVAR